MENVKFGLIQNFNPIKVSIHAKVNNKWLNPWSVSSKTKRKTLLTQCFSTNKSQNVKVS